MKRIARLMFGASLVVGMLATAAPTFADSDWSHRGSTIVTLDNATLTTIVGLGIAPSAVKPGVIDADDGMVTATFPITSMANGAIKHAGGLKLTMAQTRLSLTSYTIQGASLTARAYLNGKFLGRIPLFDLTNVKSFTSGPCTVTADLRFSSAAAGALTAVFGAPNVTGVRFGSACVAPRSHDRDDD